MEIRELDCLSEVCPIPILKAIKEFRTMEDGDILVMHSDHSCVGINVEDWAQKNAYPVEVIEVEDGEWKIYVQKPSEEKVCDQEEESLLKWLKKPWPYWVAGILLGILNVILLAMSGISWQITSGFLLWGSGIIEWFGSEPLSWEYFHHFSYYYESVLENKNVFINKYTVLNLGVIAGSLMATLLSSQFKLKRIRDFKQAAFALVGGILMGYGTRLAIGCNIGSFFSGVPSFSAHAYLFGLFVLVGAWAGSKIAIKYLM